MQVPSATNIDVALVYEIDHTKEIEYYVYPVTIWDGIS